MQQIECEVLVIGSGPGGASTAAMLAEAGQDVLLVEEGRHLALAWYTSYVDFERWSCVGLPAWLGGEVPIARLWGNRGLRLVLFGDGPKPCGKQFWGAPRHRS